MNSEKKFFSYLLASMLVLSVASCQDSTTSNDGSSQPLLSLPSSTQRALRSLGSTDITATGTVNDHNIAPRVISSNNSQIGIEATIPTSILIEGTNANRLTLQLNYPCGAGNSHIPVVSVDRQFSYNTSSGALTVAATEASYPNSDGDAHSNLKECSSGTKPYDATDPSLIKTGSIEFAVGIANDNFYDSDTNDTHPSAYHALNDSFDQAQSIGGSSETYGYVNEIKDKFDYFFVGGGGNGNISLSTASGNSNLEFRVFDVNRVFVKSSIFLGVGNEAAYDIDLPIYVSVINQRNDPASNHGSRYTLITSFPTGTSASHTASRFRVNLIDPDTGEKLWDTGSDGTYTNVLVVSSPGINRVQLTDVPVGNYRFEFASNMDSDDDPFGDTYFSVGVTGTGSVTVREGEMVTSSVTMD